MLTAIIKVTLKPEVLDPQGKAVMRSLENLGFETLESVRIGKHVEIRLDESDPAVARQKVEQMCTKLLANPVIEIFDIKIIGIE